MKKEVRIGSLVTERDFHGLVGVVYAWGIDDADHIRAVGRGASPQFCRVKWASVAAGGGVWCQVARLKVVA